MCLSGSDTNRFILEDNPSGVENGLKGKVESVRPYLVGATAVNVI